MGVKKSGSLLRELVRVRLSSDRPSFMCCDNRNIERQDVCALGRHCCVNVLSLTGEPKSVLARRAEVQIRDTRRCLPASSNRAFRKRPLFSKAKGSKGFLDDA